MKDRIRALLDRELTRLEGLSSLTKEDSLLLHRLVQTLQLLEEEGVSQVDEALELSLEELEALARS